MKHHANIPFSNLTNISKSEGKETELYITEVKEAVRNFLQKQPAYIENKILLLEFRYFPRYDHLILHLSVDGSKEFLQLLMNKIFLFYEKFVGFDGK